MPDNRSHNSPPDDAWSLLAQAGKLDKQSLAVICCWEWYETHQQIPFLKEIVSAVKARFGIQISTDCASKGRALLENWVFAREYAMRP